MTTHFVSSIYTSVRNIFKRFVLKRDAELIHVKRFII